jgi:transcription initiation factor TFIIIB Brf1 subunit/transcription initiation factor TFIIB
VYLVASGITQREIADVAGVTKETIRVRLNEMRGEL